MSWKQTYFRIRSLIALTYLTLLVAYYVVDMLAKGKGGKSGQSLMVDQAKQLTWATAVLAAVLKAATLYNFHQLDKNYKLVVDLDLIILSQTANIRMTPHYIGLHAAYFLMAFITFLFWMFYFQSDAQKKPHTNDVEMV